MPPESTIWREGRETYRGIGVKRNPGSKGIRWVAEMGCG